MTNTIPKKMDGQKGQRQQCKKKHDNKTKNTDEDNNVNENERRWQRRYMSKWQCLLYFSLFEHEGFTYTFKNPQTTPDIRYTI